MSVTRLGRGGGKWAWVPFVYRTINIPDDGCKLLPACACAVTERYKMRRNTVLLKYKHWEKFEEAKTYLFRDRSVPVPLFKPHVSYGLTWDRTR